MRELEKRQHIIRTRLNDAELEYIKRKAAGSGLEVGAYVRRAALQRREARRNYLAEEISSLNAKLLLIARQQGYGALDLAVISARLAVLIEIAESDHNR